MPKHGNVRKLPSGRYQGRYKGMDGKSHGKTFATAEEAGRWVTGQRGDVHSGEWINPEHGQTLYGDWHSRWATQRLNVRATTKAKETALASTHVLPRFEDMPLGAISPALVQAWATDLTRRLKPSSVRSVVQVLSRSLQAAVNARMIKANPCIGLTLPRIERKEMRYLNSNEVSILAAHMDSRYQALVLLGCYGGLRIGEMAALDRRHVDIAARTVRVELTANEVSGSGFVFGPPKTPRSRRTLTLPRFVVDALDEHMRTYTDPESTAAVFTSPGAARLRVNNFRRREWAQAVTSAGLGTLRVHDMRHTAVALWISTGVPSLLVSQQAGHSSVAFTLDRYGHLYGDAGTELADRLDALAGPSVGTGSNVVLLRKPEGAA